MIRPHLISPSLFALTLILSGCATQEGNVLLGVEKENLERLQDRYGTPGALQKQIDIAKTDNTGERRNELLNDLILLVDLNYYHWEKLVYEKKAYADFGSAVTATTLSSISAISKVEDVKTVLSAISSGITSTGVTFNSKVLQDQSLTAILAKMRANRAKQLLRLQASMIKTDGNNNPSGSNPLSVYSVQQGLIEIATYYNAGTFVAALQDIIEKAATEKTNSETQSNNLKPNASLINAAVPTALLRAPRAPETVSVEKFNGLKAERDFLKEHQVRIFSFVDGLTKIDRDPSKTSPQRTQIYQKIITDANLTGKVDPNANSLNTFFQDPQTTDSDRKALIDALSKALNQ